MNGTGTERPRGALTAVLRWIGGRVRGFHAAIGSYLALALAAAALASAAFLGVALAVARRRTEAWDEAALRWMETRGSPRMDGWALEVTGLAGTATVAVVLLLSTVFLWNGRHHYSAALLWAAVIGSVLLNSALKLLFDRARPEVFPWRTPHAGLSSFPSGHAMTAMVVYGILGFLAGRLAPTRFLRWVTWGVAAAVVLLVGVSRVYLGVHYPSDVVAGFLAGGVWAVACGAGIEAVRYFRGRRPGLAAEEEDLGPGVTEEDDRAEGRPRGHAA